MSVYYHGVSRVWPYAWEGSPRTSRLVHGVGIYATGRLMDLVMREVDASAPRAISSVERRLRRIEGVCAWTDGYWPRLKIWWNDLQNTSQDKRRLSTYLCEEYERSAGRGQADGDSDGGSADRSKDPSEKGSAFHGGGAALSATAAAEFDEIPLQEIAARIASTVRQVGRVHDDELPAAFTEHTGIEVPSGRERMLHKFAWSAKGLGFLEVVDGVWEPGPKDPETDPRWGAWTIAALIDRAGAVADREDAHQLLIDEIRGGQGGRVPKLVMSVAGTALNAGRRRA